MKSEAVKEDSCLSFTFSNGEKSSFLATLNSRDMINRVVFIIEATFTSLTFFLITKNIPLFCISLASVNVLCVINTDSSLTS